MLSRRNLIASGLSAAALGAFGYGLWPKLGAYNAEVARQREFPALDPKMAELIRMATLAANGHNTQPWKFQLTDGRVSILPDFARRTAVVDPDDHHLYISLGCAAENLTIAARANGWQPHLAIENKGDTRITIDLAESQERETDLYRAIPLRQSTRSEYDSTPVSNIDLELLKAAAQMDGVSVLIFTQPSELESVLELVVEGNSAQMDDPAFVAELRDWIRFTPDQALAGNDGLFSACSGNPVAPSWLAERLFAQFVKKKTENDKYRRQIRSSAGIAVFIGNKEDPEHWIKVGQSFQRFALQATVLGIRNAHINQPIEVPELREGVSRWLGMPNIRPDLIVRFGHAPTLPMSLRRPVTDIII
jgi:hypothetical protein